MIKADAASLIYVLKANLIEVLRQVYDQIVITETIYQEVVVKGKAGGHRDAFVADKMIEIGVIKVHPDSKERWELNLGMGECSMITSALEEGCSALIDDLRAMRAGLRLGLKVEYTSLALLKAYRASYITSEQFDELLETYCRVAGVSVVERHKIHRMKELLE